MDVPGPSRLNRGSIAYSSALCPLRMAARTRERHTGKIRTRSHFSHPRSSQVSGTGESLLSGRVRSLPQTSPCSRWWNNPGIHRQRTRSGIPCADQEILTQAGTVELPFSWVMDSGSPCSASTHRSGSGNFLSNGNACGISMLYARSHIGHRRFIWA
jgi:hypothetical protein